MQPRLARVLLLGALAALPLALSGCGGPAAPEAPRLQEADVPAGWTYDLEYVWPSGEDVSYAWHTQGGQSVYFQLTHTTGGTSYPLVSEHRAEGSGQRTAPQSGRYDLLWQNESGGNVTLLYQVPEGAIVRQWPPGEGPACTFFLLGAAAC